MVCSSEQAVLVLGETRGFSMIFLARSVQNYISILQNDAESSADDDEVFNAPDDQWDKEGDALSPRQ